MTMDMDLGILITVVSTGGMLLAHAAYFKGQFTARINNVEKIADRNIALISTLTANSQTVENCKEFRDQYEHTLCSIDEKVTDIQYRMMNGKVAPQGATK